MKDIIFRLNFGHVSNNEAIVHALKLREMIFQSTAHGEHVEIELEKEQAGAQDLGTVLVRVLSKEAVVALLKGIADYARLYRPEFITIADKSRQILVENLTERTATAALEKILETAKLPEHQILVHFSRHPVLHASEGLTRFSTHPEQYVSGGQISGNLSMPVPEPKLEKAKDRPVVFAIAGFSGNAQNAQMVVNEKHVLEAGLSVLVPRGFRGKPTGLSIDEDVELDILVFAPTMKLEPGRWRHLKHTRGAKKTLVTFTVIPMNPQPKDQHIEVEFYYLRQWMCQIDFTVRVLARDEVGASR